MATIHIDGNTFEVDERDNLLKTALSLGFDLPYFCWHPCLDSVGACRQCAVKQFRDENDENGKIVMACMTPCADGSRISIEDSVARDFRASVIEWLMINHPHDCPVCEEGGECHLQDMTLMTGHTRRRYRGLKRTHRNQDLGPFISHEMNRCIACYRCTRFYRDYAGGEDLQAFGAHDHVYFGRHEDGPLDNEFSGNLVEVCPTGVFTDKTLGAHYTRKWDMQHAPSVCQHCSLGCNTSPGSRKGVLKRIQNRYHGEINGYFLCDRGRFGAGFVNREDRPREPLLKTNGALAPVSRDHALETVAAMLKDAKGVIGIGSPRASLEGNYALRSLVGDAHYSSGMGANEQRLAALALDILRNNPGRNVSLRETEHCDAVLVLGEDVSQTAPRLALSLRQAVRNAAHEIARDHDIPRWHERAVRDKAGGAQSPLFVAAPTATRLDDIAVKRWRQRPHAIAQLGFAVAHALDDRAQAPGALDQETRDLAEEIAATLKAAKHPLIVAGTGSGSESILKAAANIAHALADHGNLFLTLEECNSAGGSLLGGMDVETALGEIESGEADTLVVLENDLYRRTAKPLVDTALSKAENVIVIDHSMQATIARADAVLPAGSFAEADGTLINNEGRAQRFFQVYVPDGAMQEGWRWCQDLIRAEDDQAPGWQSLDDVIDALVAEYPALKNIEQAAPDAKYRQANMRFPRSPHRFSGRTAMYAHESVHERRPQPDPDSALAYSMEGWPGRRPAALLPFSWSPGWNSNQQSITKFQDEVAGPLHGGDPGVHVVAARGGSEGDYYPAEVPVQEGWLALPLHHIFGSEPLSAQAPAIAERSPSPYFAINTADAERLGLAAGETLALDFADERRSLPVVLMDSLPPGCIGVPAGLGGLQGIHLPQELRL